MTWSVLPFVLAACERDPSTLAPTDTAATSSETGAPPTAEEPADSAADSATPATPVDCDALPPGPVPFTPYDIATQEDFDFDAEGRLIYLDGASMSSALLRTDMAGATDVVAVGLADTRGISVLPDGDIAIAFFADGRIGALDPATGATRNLVTGLSSPNAVEVDDADTLYFTDYGAVRRLELATGESTTLADGFVFPNGLSFDQDHDTLYVADNTVGVFRMTRAEDDSWSEPELVIAAGPYAQAFDAIEVDVCGNLYVLGFDNGALYRFDPVTFDATLLLDFEPSPGAVYTAIHWGSGIGGWRRDVLYATSRDDVLGAEVGAPGRDQPVDSVP